MKTTKKIRNDIRVRLLKNPVMGGIAAELQKALRDAYDDLDCLEELDEESSRGNDRSN